jgi:hypothetical protein
MSKTLTLKSLFVLAAFTLGAGCASAEDGKRCFEDGLKNDYSNSVPNISLKHEAGHENEHENEHGVGDQHANQMSEHHNDDIGSGINVSPVSEPATDAMLLAGLVMVGTLVRRKSKSSGSTLCV